MITEDDLRRLQTDLILRRGRIDRVPGVPRLEKMRWRNPQRKRGARGGFRVFFVDFAERQTVVLLYLMDKVDSDDLSPSQRRRLADVIRELRKELEK